MKKKWIVLLAALLCVGMMAGCGQTKDDTKDDADTKQQTSQNVDADDTDDADDADNAGGETGDLITEKIVLSGTYYSGQVQVTVTINPDGTALMNANGTESEGTWEAGEGDVFIVAHFEGDSTVDLEISEEDGAYTAPFSVVPGMTLSGR